MKRIVLCVLVIFLAQPLWSQTEKRTKEKEEAKTEKEVSDNKKLAKAKPSKDKVDKDDKEDKKKTSTSKSNSSRPSPSTRPSYNRRGDKTEPVTVVTYYNDLPLKFLPSIKSYIKRMNSSGTGYVRKDSKDLREQFIRHKNIEKNFLQLQMSGETQVARLKLYPLANGRPLVALETTDCEAFCSNQIHFYRKDTGKWKDVTTEYMPELDKKDILKRLESKYRSIYLDLKIYESRNFQDSASFRNALLFTIQQEEGTILITEQYVRMPLYEMIWDEKKSKFTMKKI